MAVVRGSLAHRLGNRYNPVVLPDGGAGNPERGSQEASFPLDLVTPQLEKVLSSEAFVHSPQLCRFLRFIVEQEIAGQSDQLKEYVLGLQVLRKDESFDPRIDTAVRSEARRLRQKLAEYYQSEGKNDPIAIAVPKGSYRPVFTSRVEANASPVRRRHPRNWPRPRPLPRFPRLRGREGN